MDLGKVPAVCSQFFPDIWHRIYPYDIHAAVGQIQEIIHHLVKHRRIPVIQIPLVGIKAGHHIAACFRKIGEIARRSGGEYLGHGLFVLPWNIIGIIEKVPVPVLPLTGPGPLCPFMFLGSMVHHKIQAQADSPLMALICQRP